MKRIGVLVLGLCVLAGVAGDAAATLRGMNRITGTVTDEGGAPVPGVTIRASLGAEPGSIDGSTDDKGAWTVAGMAKGEWSVMFMKAGFGPIRARVILPADMSRVEPIKITLKRQ
jgi:hypothetical protein